MNFLVIALQGPQSITNLKRWFVIVITFTIKSFAIILAVVVFPIPLIPVNKKAWANLPSFKAFLGVN